MNATERRSSGRPRVGVERMLRLNISVPPKIVEKLDGLADTRRTSVSEEVRRLLTGALAQGELRGEENHDE